MSLNKENIVLDKIKKECFVITVDFCNEDIGTLFVMKNLGGAKFEIIKELHDKEATNFYNNVVR